LDDSDAFRPEHDKKDIFFDCHWRFLPLSHPFKSDRWSFLKGKAIRKGPRTQKLETDIMEMLDDLKESENGVFKGIVKIRIGLIKVVFGNSLMQKHWYYPTTSIWCTKSEPLWKASWACVLNLPVSWKFTWMQGKT
jgi:hypothetical protein